MFGRPKILSGKNWVGSATEVPLVILQNILQLPIALTIGGSNNGTFTLKGSTNPIPVWIENDVAYLDEDLAYTWNNTSNNILDSDGAADTDVDSVVGVWYMYLGVVSGVITLLPSQTFPTSTPGPGGAGGLLTHPGTSRTTVWRYVGYMVCTNASTPAFLATEKSGYWYEFADQSVVTGTSWVALDFSGVLPAHGVECAGSIETSATSGDTTEVGTASTDGMGAYLVKTAAAVLSYAAFGPLTVNSDGKFFGSSTTAAGDVRVTRVRDLV